MQMIAALENVIDGDKDQVLVIDLGPSQARPINDIESIGRPLDARERGPVVF